MNVCSIMLSTREILETDTVDSFLGSDLGPGLGFGYLNIALSSGLSVSKEDVASSVLSIV